MIKNIILLLSFLFSVACSQAEQPNANVEPQTQGSAVASIGAQAKGFPSAAELFAKKASDQMVDGIGKVVRLLPDDNKGSRHQKFLVRIAGGQTLLFAHNIDLALRIDTLKVGDEVGFRGEYSYNQKGGVVHWTHLDPRNEHEAGWIKHSGITYQ